MKVSEAVIKVIEEWDIPYVYGIPGGQTLFFTDELMRSTKTEFIQTRHEGVAAAAADAYGRLTGKPGLCLATTGPGATNLLTGIGGALRDSSPMIAFTFQNTLAGAGRGDAQEANHELIFSSLVKKYIPVRSADAAVWAVREAYRTAVTGKPGPVVVDFYRDIIEKGECDYTPLAVDQYAVLNSSGPSKETVDKLVEIINSYGKIAIWSGNGVKMTHCGSKVIELAEKLNAPIVTTFNGISSVPTENPLVLGARSRHGSVVTRAALEEADCLIVLGSSMSSVSTNRWGLKLKDIIQIDFEPSQIGKQYPVKFGVCAELRATLDALNAREDLRKSTIEQDKWTKDMQERFAKWKENVYKGPINDETACPCSPVAVVRKLNEMFKKDDIICVDAGNPGCWSHLFNFTLDNRYMKPVNYGNMGFCLPAVLACSMAEPEKDVFGIIGDGSLGMTLGDLETIGKLCKNAIVVVFNDHAYGNIKQEELFKFGEGHYYGVCLPYIEYSKVAEVFGFGAEVVKKAEDLPAAIKRARKYDGAYMIEIDFDGSYSIWPEAFNWNV